MFDIVRSWDSVEINSVYNICVKSLDILGVAGGEKIGR